jgi:hypothetical protein
MCKDITHRDGGWGWRKTVVVLGAKANQGKFGGKGTRHEFYTTSMPLWEDLAEDPGPKVRD